MTKTKRQKNSTPTEAKTVVKSGITLTVVSNTFYNGEIVRAGEKIVVDEAFYQRVLSEKNKHFN